MWMIIAYGLLALSAINANADYDDVIVNDNYLKMENMCPQSSEEKKRISIDNNDRIIKPTNTGTDFFEDMETIDIKHIKNVKAVILRRIEREILNKMNEQLNKWNEPPENETRKDYYIIIVVALYGLGFFTGILSARIYYVNLP